MIPDFVAMIYANLLGTYNGSRDEDTYKRIAKEAIKAAVILSEEIDQYQFDATESSVNGEFDEFMKKVKNP
jgi:hypothetical protein